MYWYTLLPLLRELLSLETLFQGIFAWISVTSINLPGSTERTLQPPEYVKTPVACFTSNSQVFAVHHSTTLATYELAVDRFKDFRYFRDGEVIGVLAHATFLSCRRDASLKKRSIIGEVAEAEVHTLVPLFFRKEIHGVAESWPEVSPGPL